MNTPIPSNTYRHKTVRAHLSVLLVTFATVSTAQPAPILNPANGHTYEFIDQALTWADARSAAANRSTAGRLCYLATITSQAENDFVVNQVLPPPREDIWIGGERKLSCPTDATDDSASNWGTWITGEAWSYTDWKSDEPDDCSDNCLAYTGAGDAPPWQWGGDGCSNQNPLLVECESRATPIPALPGPATVAISLLLAALGWWVLKRRRTRAG